MARRRWSRAQEERVVGLVGRCAGSHRQLEHAHSHVVAAGGEHNNYVAAKLVRAFADLGLLRHARKVFDAVPEPNAFLWNALIRGYSNPSGPDGGCGDDCCAEALHLYAQMHRSCSAAPPLTFTLSSLLKACAGLSLLEEGKQIHVHVFKYGFQFDTRVQTTLVDLYGRCRRLVDAQRVFDRAVSVEGGRGDVQLWNTMIAGCCLTGDMGHARYLFDEMSNRNTFTWVEMVGGYAAARQMDCARRLFDELPLSRDVDRVVVCTAMITGYTKCGDMVAARAVFDNVSERDIAMWNAMITGYTSVGCPEQAVAVFRLMIDDSRGSNRVRPNRATIAIISSACAQSGSAELVKWIEDYVDSCGAGLLNNRTVAALVDMHAKCGDLCSAYDIFQRWKHKDLICYSSMIAGFGIHGRGRDAIQVFEDLVDAGLRPDGICFVSVLSACSHAGLVDEGRRYFKLMRHDYGIAPAADHYMCMVDLLGRAGQIKQALRIINEDLPPEVHPHAGIWGALLSACRMHRDVEVAEEAVGHLMDLEPENDGNYVMLSNIYAEARRWEDVARVRALMRSRGMRKLPGWSWLEVGGRLHKFMTGEVADPQLELMLAVLGWELSAEG